MANYTTEQKDKNKVAVTKYRQKRYEWLIAQKSKPCIDCGNRYPFYVMDFDHVRGAKEFSISDARYKSITIHNLEKEIAKCDLVCANCHRIRTYERID